MDDEGDLEGLFVVSPFAGQTAVPHVVSVVGGVDDDGVVGLAGGFEGGEESADGLVNAADHAVVGADVGLVFFWGIPAPIVALAGDAGFDEGGEAVEVFSGVEDGVGEVFVAVEVVDCFGPGELADAGSVVVVFGVGCVEPVVKGEGLILGLFFDEVDAVVDDEFGLVANGAVGLFFVEGVSADELVGVEMVGGFEAVVGMSVPFTDVAGAVVVLAEEVGVEGFDSFGAGVVGFAGGAVAASGHAGEDGGATGPADRVADDGIFEAGSFLGEFVDVGGVDIRVAVAAEGAGGLVVGKEEDDVGFFAFSAGVLNEQGEEEKDGVSHTCVSVSRMAACWRVIGFL